MKEIQLKDQKIKELEDIIKISSDKLVEVTNYIRDNDHRIRGQLRLSYIPPGETESKTLRETLDSLHERLNMLESGSPSDN